MVADHLARQPHAGRALGGEHLPLGDGHARRLALDELDAAGRAARVAAARVQHVDVRILLDGQHETLA